MKHETKNDIEANSFARSLLMPEELVKQELKKMLKVEKVTCFDLCDDGAAWLYKLSNKFEVSEAMMVLRLQELGLVK